jgi:hypothetical protein
MLRAVGFSPAEPVLAEQQPGKLPAEQRSASPPASPEAKQGSNLPPRGKRDTLKDWLPGALKRWPPDTTDMGTQDLIEFLQGKAPKAWKRHSIQNELSRLRRAETGMAELPKTKNFRKLRS